MGLLPGLGLPERGLQSHRELRGCLPCRAVEVRMDAQVTFDACWRRFEEKFRLQVLPLRLPGVFDTGLTDV